MTSIEEAGLFMLKSSWIGRGLSCAAVTVLLASGCVSSSRHPDAGDAGTDGDASDAADFDAGPDAGPVDGGPVDSGYYAGAVSVTSAVAKVKNILIGLPPTDDEVQLVEFDEANLQVLIDRWMQTPEYFDKMLGFFTTSFQQDQWSFSDLTFQFRGDIPFSMDTARITQNLQQSFGRTALELIRQGRPFNSVLTTKSYMMTPAVMAVYATVDTTHVDDNYNLLDLFQQETPTQVTLQSTTPVPIEDVVNPLSENFMKFYDPAIAASYREGCPFGTITYDSPASYRAVTDFLYNHQPLPPQGGCTPPFTPRADRYVVDSDFTNWQMVSVRQPRRHEATTRLYDLPSMRAGHELVLHVPRMSFFTTPAFFARWQTNDSNQHRVTINQTMIISLGQPIDLTNTTHPLNLAALDVEHANEGSTCYECHQSLDPMRQFFSQTFTYYFSTQDRSSMQAIDGQFAFHDVVGSGSSVDDLGPLLATHPMFGPAWVQKLCTWANSVRCDEGDPEFRRLVDLFIDSNYSWNALVKAVFSSPLVTNLHETQSAETVGPVFPVARQTHLCATLANRLGVKNLCGLDVNSSGLNATVQTIAASWPSDQYSRGAVTPAQTIDASPMIRGGMENLCSSLANRFVDDGASGFESGDPMTATQNLAAKLMGLTSDRVAGPLGILREHYAAAIEAGATPRTAMRSTFVLACLSPYVASIGQ